MKKPVALIFGHSGGIGSATKDLFLEKKYKIIPVNSKIIDFAHVNSDQKIMELLTSAKPDVIVNAAGIFVKGYSSDHTESLDINFGSNWSIIRHYLNKDNQTQDTSIVIVGSNSYNGGRPAYPLYSASKAAVHNLWQSSTELFKNTNVHLSLINPVRVKTKMVAVNNQFDPALDYLESEEVAKEIFRLADNRLSICLDMNFKGIK